jgi:hypothetical protein
MRPFLAVAAPLLLASISWGQRIEVTIPASSTLHGHLILVIAKNAEIEPRMQFSPTYHSAQGFGVDVENLAPGTPVVIDAHTIGFPRESLTDLDAGDYMVQAVFNVYEPFHLASGKTLWLPPDKGEGQHWNFKPGNPYDAPVKLHFDAKATLKLTLDKVIPPIEGTEDDPVVMAARGPGAKWLKFVRFRSEKLSKFWGRDMYLGAWVLLPDGFDEHPEAHYPLVVYQDHYHASFAAGWASDYGPLSFVATKPEEKEPQGGYWLKMLADMGMTGQKGRPGADGYRLFQDWTSGRLPRVILLYVQNANPYYDDSYAVDSANVGPYGAAINEELIPALEAKYRGLGQGWARATYGGSTGGWESIASQVFYPDMYNGAYTACPDPVDFHSYLNIDLYQDANAFTRKGDFENIAIPGARKPDGAIVATVKDQFRFEYVLGTHGRSTEQADIWQAVFSPAGPDGYPAQIVDPLTGAIDQSVVAYWHDHYDLTSMLKRDWPTLGPKLEGKLHFAVGDSDTFFLNNGVHLLQATTDATRNPHSDATFQYVPGAPHCATGGPLENNVQQNNSNWLQRVLPLMVDHMVKTAPAGADVTSWRY